jgi:hypothetical protein
LLFAFGRPDAPRSAVWAVDTKPPKRDVYLAPVPMMRDFKTSLHQSRDWRAAFTREHVDGPDSRVAPGDDRVVHYFGPSDELVPGAVRMHGVVVPWFSIVPAAPVPADLTVVWLDPPGPGESAD